MNNLYLERDGDILARFKISSDMFTAGAQIRDAFDTLRGYIETTDRFKVEGDAHFGFTKALDLLDCVYDGYGLAGTPMSSSTPTRLSPWLSRSPKTLARKPRPTRPLVSIWGPTRNSTTSIWAELATILTKTVAYLAGRVRSQTRLKSRSTTVRLTLPRAMIGRSTLGRTSCGRSRSTAVLVAIADISYPARAVVAGRTSES
jgi:hypothetical protein